MASSDLTRSQFLSRSAKGGLGLLAASSLAGLAAEPAQAAVRNEFFAIFTNFGSAPRANAFLDVSANTDAAPQGANILFTVFLNGTQLAEFTTQTNANGFASSAAAQGPNRNLFRLTNGEPGLVRARVPSGATTATAILHQRGQGSRLIVAVPPAVLAAGTVFPVTIGDIATGALLIGNVAGGEVNADVFVGSTGAPGAGKYNVQLRDNQIGRIDLQPDDINSHLLVVASGEILVQLMIDDGRVNGITCLPL